MSTEAPARQGKGIAVSVVGLTGLLWGGAWAVLGVSLLCNAAVIMTRQLGEEEATGGFAQVDRWLTSVGAGLAAVIGIVVLLQGALGMLAGLGVLRRKQWGRILMFVVAGLAVLWGLLFLCASGERFAYLALGAAQVLYGLLALALLIKDRAEFAGKSANGP